MLPDFTKKPSFYAYKDWAGSAGRPCAPLPMSFSAPVRLSNGALRLGFTGTAGFSYSIQASTTLTEWMTIATNLPGSNGNYFHDDSHVTNFSSRFYRVIWP